MDVSLLGILLAAPQDDSLEALTDIATEQSWLAAAVAELQTLSLEEWQAEHTRLFITGHPYTACLPFESAWREGRMAGHSLIKIQQLYAHTGFTPSAELPADYLGSELEWLASLLLAETLDEEVFMQALVHLREWVPAFAQTLQQESKLALYRVIAQKLETLLA